VFVSVSKGVKKEEEVIMAITRTSSNNKQQQQQKREKQKNISYGANHTCKKLRSESIPFVFLRV